LFSKHGISAVPVCDKEGALLLAEGTDLAPEFVDYLRLDKRTARHLMTVPAITAAEDTPVSEIADLLQRHRIT